jgi:hypothetical protein
VRLGGSGCVECGRQCDYRGRQYRIAIWSQETRVHHRCRRALHASYPQSCVRHDRRVGCHDPCSSRHCGRRGYDENSSSHDSNHDVRRKTHRRESASASGQGYLSRGKSGQAAGTVSVNLSFDVLLGTVNDDGSIKPNLVPVVVPDVPLAD